MQQLKDDMSRIPSAHQAAKYGDGTDLNTSTEEEPVHSLATDVS